MWQQLMPALRITAVMTVLTGLLYPALVTGIAQMVFPGKADGTLIARNGQVIGSELIGQAFTRPEYFHPRPSAAGGGYDAMVSGGSNLGPTSSRLAQRVRESVAGYRAANLYNTGQVPPDAVLASASGLDPHITPENAMLQAARVAKVRGIDLAHVLQLIRQVQENRDFGVLGEPRVNVLRLNLRLDEGFPLKR